MLGVLQYSKWKDAPPPQSLFMLIINWVICGAGGLGPIQIQTGEMKLILCKFS